jgi:hypothetical protein
MSLLLTLLFAAGAPGAPPHQVTLALDEYERLRKLDERPSLTVLDLLQVDGSFARRDLAVVLTGRAAGALPTVNVLSGEGFRVHTCKGDALLSRGEKGEFALTPLAPRFQLRCKVALDGSDRLEARASRAVLEVAADVADGELVASDGGSGERSFSIVRRIAGGQGELPPSVAGRYRVTLLPDETRFLYRLEVRNPSRGHSQFQVALRESEHVESVDAPVAWDVAGTGYRFDLPPGETAIALRGRLASTTFVPPVDASLQYLVLEAHPLIRPEVRTAARRVGLGEAGIEAQYRGAQAFLLGGRVEVGIAATRLEALKTAGFAVSRLAQIFFFAADGKVRGETTLSIDNQGAPALALPTGGEPMFASIAGEPAFLTRDAEGRLFLPLAQGKQDVVVQDVRPFRARAGLALARLELPRTGVPASRADVQLRYPAEWIPLYEELAPAGRWSFVRPESLVLVALLLVLAERLLALAGLRRSRRLVLAGSLALAGALSHAVLVIGLAASAAPLLALAATAALRRLRGALRVVAIAAGAAALILLVVVLAGLGFVARLERSEGAPIGPGYSKMASEPRASSLDRSEAEAAAPDAGREEGKGESFQGLPARIEIPWGALRTGFSREMLASDGSRSVVVVLATARLVAALAWAASLALVVLALILRRDLAGGARRLGARFRGVDAAP